MNTSNQATASALPLQGYRIVDLTTFLSGPFCTQILADLGAEVVKIEAPEGDSSRAIPPHFLGDDSMYFMSTNRSKKSVCVNMKEKQGLRLVLDLMAKADVVVENFRPGVAARIGLDIDQIRKDNPQLVWASISGFGQVGPWRDQPAYDMIVQALSGVMSLTGEPGRPAVRLGIPAGDMVAGMYASIAINAALADRERGAPGRVIDISMLDCQLAMLSYQSAYALYSNVTPQPQAARHDSIPTYRSFKGQDGRELVVTANTEKMWRGLCLVLGLASLPDDPRFLNARSRLENKEALWPLLEAAFLRQDATDWIAPLVEAGVPVALVKTVPEALDDARNGERDMIVRVSDDQGHSTELVGNPIKFTGADPVDSTFPPALGNDAFQVLSGWLGLPREAVQGLVGAQVLHMRC
ncbi:MULTISPECIES: CaiB/BaiF CoA-transferase family protein [unclassified Achromobacter]|uniref:CaiB/BaiF CoA transferase family protein n=1 Tax=unclassified Achromobacter TaxID=2626865 RepID=UPI000B5173E3|nr:MULTISPECIES: CoA transferase [unclassified Achromobacter]OWT71562.1 carnitine dehydratase [Achromobacter sp. HZ34]OWT73219.1 carnitine dehydratase [Achromobacter sp. HZ28]